MPRPTFARFVRLALATLAVGLAGASCVLVVPAPDNVSTTTCHFQGETTACGQCIQKSCQDTINACCVEGACADTLKALDACAPAPSLQSCDPLVTPTGEPTGDAARVCIAAHCSDACDAIPCTLADVPATPCRDCMQAACSAEIDSCCNDSSGVCNLHVLVARDCATTQSPADCVRLSPFDPYIPPGGKALSACVAAHCGKVCPINGANKCAGSKDCIGCCSTKFAAGHDKSFQLDTACACPPGGCAVDCRLTAYCDASQPVPGDACLSCLTNNEDWGQACHFAPDCYVDTGCVEFTTCYAQCAAGG